MAFRLIPRDEAFYPLFDAAASNASGAARQLAVALTTLPMPEATMRSIAAAEKTGDEITRSVRHRLETSLVTPFDREDIQYLAGSLDDVMDEIRAAADLTYLHNVTDILPGVDTLVSLLENAAELNVGLVGKLRSLKGIAAAVDEIDAIESEADAQYRRVMAELFNGSHDALEILRWKDVVEAVEKAINAVERASDIIQSISVKHA